MTNYTLCIGGFRVKTPNAQQGIAKSGAEVFQLKIFAIFEHWYFY